MENSIDENKSILKRIFFDEFNKNGYSPTDYFDFSVWFIKRHDKNSHSQSKDYFQEILSQTPTENDDIIKFVLIRSFIRTRNKYFKIRVLDFVEEIVDIVINLNAENSRVDTLIKNYDAYETKNVIEQNLHYYDKLMKNNDMMKSSLFTIIDRIENMNKGDYKLSLMISYINDDRIYNDQYINNNNKTEIKEKVLEYKLNQIVKIKEDNNVYNFKEDEDYQYSFSESEFYSYEIKNRINKFDSGTNMLYFYIKIDNLNKHFEDVVISEKIPIFDVLLANIKSLLNNFKKVKPLDTYVKIQNSFMDSTIKLTLNIEFDPYTLSSIYNKIITLLQDMISYKVHVEHQWRTIMNYFEEISPKIEDLLKNDEKKESSCVIY